MLPGSALRAASLGFAERTGQPAGHRWVAALPLHHVGGLMVAVRSVVAGTTPVACASLGGAEPFTVEVFAQATGRAVTLSTADHRPLAVSLVPPMLAVLDAAGATGWGLLAEYDVVLVGGAATPKSLVDRLLSAGVHLHTSYGMTETCGGVVVDGHPLPGTSVSAQPDGRLRICGPQVALGYRDGRSPERWGSAAGSACFDTQDLGAVGPDGVVTVLGRVDDVVQVGGASVALTAVADVLRADPRVAAAEVVALPDERFGATLVAVVVAGGPGGAAGPGPGAEELAGLVEDQLGRAARPRVVRLVTGIPLLESGKPDRAALQDLAGSAAR
jgi:O-succinylbenzoic acid--CoA ligase